ncbi:hypothetical protein HDU92_003122 [Lobulomyces angularis]|nr:hypothetical protein HDU92_003122 [Lobulomyces angularis]
MVSETDDTEKQFAIKAFEAQSKRKYRIRLLKFCFSFQMFVIFLIMVKAMLSEDLTEFKLATETPTAPIFSITDTTSQNKTLIAAEEKIFVTNESTSNPAVNDKIKYAETKIKNVDVVNDYSFIDTLSTFNFSSLIYDIGLGRAAKEQRIELNEKIFKFLIKEPIVPVNEECHLPEVKVPTKEECMSAGSYVFTGLKNNPSKIGILIQLGFDADTLEIYLHQIYDLIDYFFIIESTTSHLFNQPKPLLWQTLQIQPRFEKFKSKVVNFVLDDADTAKNIGSSSIWALESQQENQRWTKFIQWNEYHKVFGDEDVLGFGDADEIPSRKNVVLLKYCKISKNVKNAIDIGIWFPLSYIKWSFKTDFPVHSSVPYSLGDPSFWKLSNAKNYFANGKLPTRMRGTSRNYLLGGAHLSNYLYPPFAMLKLLTCTECTTNDFLRSWSDLIDKKDVAGLEKWFVDYNINSYAYRTIPIENLTAGNKEAVSIPWFLSCNLKRYPSWLRKSDTRIH